MLHGLPLDFLMVTTCEGIKSTWNWLGNQNLHKVVGPILVVEVAEEVEAMDGDEVVAIVIVDTVHISRIRAALIS